jgi:hypothetical protein
MSSSSWVWIVLCDSNAACMHARASSERAASYRIVSYRIVWRCEVSRLWWLLLHLCSSTFCSRVNRWKATQTAAAVTAAAVETATRWLAEMDAHSVDTAAASCEERCAHHLESFNLVQYSSILLLNCLRRQWSIKRTTCWHMVHFKTQRRNTREAHLLLPMHSLPIENYQS